MKTTKKMKILREMIEEACFANSITNWHMNDFFLDFTIKYYPKAKKIRTVQIAFNRYSNMLVEIGILKKAVRLGAGWGSYSEFGSRTQTIWQYNFSLTKEEALKRLERRIN